ncbi:hypothetical protein OLMES_3225 [Oleiphilus messinensis]|uniref:Uncharacterized protein n=1 Tax=Oleiphilus messinensis TaxID=141451 RepID=A0A1Y0IBX2_9GAMM|nr:hypothetical protein [Oleiphilus messinensis]ARU57266.1 hypothetical protein OLMES_3225 [Oleiphilus messinensis]
MNDVIPLPDVEESAGDFSQALTALEEKKAALARVIEIAQSMTALQSGLLAAVNLSQPLKQLPPKTLRFIDDLGRKTRNLSDRDVSLRLEKLDLKIKVKLKSIVLVSDKAQNLGYQILTDDRLGEVHALIDEFKRLSQTAIALRVLLSKRGVKVSPLALPVEKDEILDRIDQIEVEQKNYRDNAVTKIRDMKNDIEGMLRSSQCREQVKPLLLSVLSDLDLNEQHIASGGDFTDMPVAMASIDIVGIEGVHVSHIDQDIQSQEREPSEAAAENELQQANENPEGSEGDDSGLRKLGFWQKLKLWLTTSWNVSWRDLDKSDRL